MTIEEEIRAAIEKKQAMEQKAFALTKEERMHICDMGFYNDVIRGYLIRSMRNADFTKEDIERALRGLHHALDDMSAAEAAEIDL